MAGPLLLLVGLAAVAGPATDILSQSACQAHDRSLSGSNRISIRIRSLSCQDHMCHDHVRIKPGLCKTHV